METWEILAAVAAGMGLRFKMKYGDVGEITREIERAVPGYAAVPAAGEAGGAIWGLEGFPLRPGAPRADLLAETVLPKPTLSLDYLEGRFGRWFEEIFRTARAARDAEATARAGFAV